MLGDYFNMTVWATGLIILTFLQFMNTITQDSDRLVYEKHSSSWGYFFTVVIILYIGLRPLEKYGDSWLYSTMFNLVQTGQWSTFYSIKSEWLWDKIEYFFIDHSTCQMWYLCIATLYVGCIGIAVKRWIPKNYTLAMMFAITAMSFHAYGTNGLRNGLSTSIALMALSFLFTEKRRYVISFLLLYFAISIHSSVAVIMASAVLALFFHNARINTIIWIVCILISIVFSDSIVALLTQLLGDGRMSFYSELDNTFYVNKGFRYDFILYSSIPIILGWIVCVKNDLRDGIYEYILATYTIANSGWVLINTIAYSNRFAYLSWFLYPILLAYPFLKFRFMEYQSRMAGILLLFHLSIYLALG